MCTARSNEQAGRSGRTDLPFGDQASTFLQAGSEGWKKGQLQTQDPVSGFNGPSGPPS